MLTSSKVEIDIYYMTPLKQTSSTGPRALAGSHSHSITQSLQREGAPCHDQCGLEGTRWTFICGSSETIAAYGEKQVVLTQMTINSSVLWNHASFTYPESSPETLDQI